MSRVYSIYVLIDPRTQAVRYVGKTRWTFKKRLAEHLWFARATQIATPHYEWIRTLLAVGEKPQAAIIDWCDTEKEAYLIEKEWMRCYQQLGAKLTNRIPKVRHTPRFTRVHISFSLSEKMREEFGPGTLAEHVRRIIEEHYEK